MDPVVATMIVLAIITVGEIVSIKTRAKVPTLLIVLVGMFALLKAGILPKNIIEASTFSVVGAVLQPALLVHMGTLIPIKVMKSQYKAVLISLIGISFSVILIFLIATPLFGYETAVAGSGPLTGGLIAYLVTSEALKNVGLVSLAAIPLIVLALQGITGMPLTSILLRRHGFKIRQSMDAGHFTSASVVAEDISGDGSEENQVNKGGKKRTLVPEKYQNSSFILLFMIFIGGSLAVWLENLTGISYSLFGLAIGIIGTYAGFYPQKALEQANGFSIAMVGLIFIVVGSLATISFNDVIAILPEVILIIIIGTAGLVAGGYIGSKLFKWDPCKGIPIALTALYGFPGDYLISQEVSRSVGRNKKEEDAIFNEVLSPMLIGGFTSVTVGSVIIASLLVQTL